MDTPPSPSKSKQKRTKKKKTSDSSEPGSGVEGEGSPKHGKKKIVPPPLPPQRRRTQPEFMRELEAEMAGRRNREGGATEGKDTPPMAGRRNRNSGEGGATEGKDTPPTAERKSGDNGEGGATEGKDTPTLSRVGSDKEPNLTTNLNLDRNQSTFGSPLRTRGLLKPHAGAAPMPPSSVALPTSTSHAGEGEEVLKHPANPPPVLAKPQKAPGTKQGCSGLDEPDFAVPDNGGSKQEAEEAGLIRSKVKQDLLVVESSITSALKEQAGSRMGR